MLRPQAVCSETQRTNIHILTQVAAVLLDYATGEMKVHLSPLFFWRKKGKRQKRKERKKVVKNEGRNKTISSRISIFFFC